MTENIIPISAPTIRLTGTRILADGSTETATSLVAAQRTIASSPAIISEPIIYTFANYVIVTMTAPADVTLEDYSAAPSVIDPFLLNDKTGMLQTTQAKGNILYFLGTKMPSPTEAEIYTRWFALVSPNIDPAHAAQLVSIYSVKGYYAVSDVTSITAAVFVEGKVGTEAIVNIRVV